MLDTTMWKLDGTGERIVYYGKVREVTQMTFYRHRITNRLKIIYAAISR